MEHLIISQTLKVVFIIQIQTLLIDLIREAPMADHNTTGGPTSPVSLLKERLLAKYPKAEEEGLMCIKHCKYNGKEAGVMLRCCTCAHWFHTKCIDLKEDEAVGIWPCHTCRFIAHDISQQQVTINKLMDIINTQQAQINEIMTSQVRTNANVNLLTQNIQNLASHITPELCSESDSDSDSDEEDEPERHFLIGDSILKDVDPIDDNLVLNYQSGAKFNDIKKKIKGIKGKKYKDMTIVCGTNDSATKKPIDKILEDCKNTITAAKSKASHIHLSSILPRTDNRADMSKIDTLNQMLVLLANEQDIHFVNNDNNFRYRNDSPDESVLLPGDNLHLTAMGTTRLLKNLGLADMAVSKMGKGPANRWPGNNPENLNVHQSTSMPPIEYQSRIPAFTPQASRHQTRMPSFSRPPYHSGLYHTHHTTGMPAKSLSPQDQTSHPATRSPGKQWPGIKRLPHQRRKHYFRGAQDPLSNFYAVQFSAFGHMFKSLEHAYQWNKAKYLGLHRVADHIMNTTTASQVKQTADEELITSGTNWWKDRKTIMHELLTLKCQQCPTFLSALVDSGSDELIEDTNHEYWARGRTGHGQNMLGQLLMIIRQELVNGHSAQTAVDYRPPANEVVSPCYLCGEGNHNSATCRHQSFLQCRKCFYQGHKSKHCPDRF